MSIPTGVIPPNGWHFYVNEKDEEPLRAETYLQLEKALTDYRIANNEPVGSPADDIERQLCGRWPHLCGRRNPIEPEDLDRPTLEYGRPAQRTLAERIFAWMSNRYSRLGTIEIVTSAEAERRSSICISCPKNQDWRHYYRDCPGCADKLKKLTADLWKLRKGKEVTRENKLLGCASLGHDNATAVWLTEAALKHAKHYQAQLPPQCWLKTPEAVSADSASSGAES